MILKKTSISHHSTKEADRVLDLLVQKLISVQHFLVSKEKMLPSLNNVQIFYSICAFFKTYGVDLQRPLETKTDKLKEF